MSEPNEVERVYQRLEAEGYRFIGRQHGDAYTVFTFYARDTEPRHTLLVHAIYTDETHTDVQHCEVYAPR